MIDYKIQVLIFNVLKTFYGLLLKQEMPTQPIIGLLSIVRIGLLR